MKAARFALFACMAGLSALNPIASAANEAADLFNTGAVAGMSASAGGLSLGGSRIACASCHGRDGGGRSEGDALAPAIMRGLGGLDRAGVTPSGKIRPAYSPETFGKALIDGVSPDGRTLSPRMPRYRIDDASVKELWAYLQTLPVEQRRGVTASGLTFALPAPAAFMAQAEQLRTIVQAKADALSGSRPRLRFVVELFEPSVSPDAPCPGAQALALVFAFVDMDRNIFDRARRCGVPVLFPLADLVGHENPLDVRADRAPLLAQWKALLAAAGPQASILVPDASRVWEREALAFANIRQRNGDTSALVLPFGLNRSNPDRPPADVYAPLYGSAASLALWQSKGHRLHLAVTTPQGSPSSIETVAETLAAILDRAADGAGPDVTRALFMEAIGRIGPDPVTFGIDYAAHRLTGRTYVRIERF